MISKYEVPDPSSVSYADIAWTEAFLDCARGRWQKLSFGLGSLEDISEVEVAEFLPSVPQETTASSSTAEWDPDMMFESSNENEEEKLAKAEEQQDAAEGEKQEKLAKAEKLKAEKLPKAEKQAKAKAQGKAGSRVRQRAKRSS